MRFEGRLHYGLVASRWLRSRCPCLRSEKAIGLFFPAQKAVQHHGHVARWLCGLRWHCLQGGDRGVILASLIPGKIYL